MTSCRSQQEILLALRDLGDEHRPEEDLWPGIAQRLHRYHRPSWQALAVAAALVFGVGLGIDRLSTPLPENRIAGQSPDALLVTREFQAAAEDIRRWAQLAPQPERAPGHEDIRASLAELEQAAQQLRRALNRSGKSALLLPLLVSVQRKQLHLLTYGDA